MQLLRIRVLAAATGCQFVNSDHSEPEKLSKVSFFGVTSKLNVLSEPFLLLSWHVEAPSACVYFQPSARSQHCNSPFGHFCQHVSLRTKEKQKVEE